MNDITSIIKWIPIETFIQNNRISDRFLIAINRSSRYYEIQIDFYNHSDKKFRDCVSPNIEYVAFLPEQNIC